jgi:predicted acylesterase/phospholipase RssA/CRP-like cAMP-binding protein
VLASPAADGGAEGEYPRLRGAFAIVIAEAAPSREGSVAMEVSEQSSGPSTSASPWAGAVERVVGAGEVLVREGDAGDAVFDVVSGAFEILKGPELARIHVVGPGATIGEIAALARCPRTATVRALERSVVRQLDLASYERWMARDERALTELTRVARARIDRHRTIELVSELLAVDAAVAAEVVDSGECVNLEAGEILFAEGDRSDAAFLVVSGRLAAWRDGIAIGEIARGEVVGELGLIERAPRSATVTALRGSTLARFGMETFRALAASHPSLMLQLSRSILARLATAPAKLDRARSIAVAVTAACDTRECLTRLAVEIARHGTTRHLWPAHIDTALGRPGLVESGSALALPAVSEYLHEVETSNDYLVLEADPSATPWTRMALALADRIVVVASAHPDDAELRRIEEVLAAVPPRARIERWLALVHPPATARPRGAAAIGDRLGFDRVAHLHNGSPADLHRLARLVSGNATGLVLGGGGARGFAHLGVWRALDELGIEVDTIGGASIGAPLGALMALGTAPRELIALVTELFHGLLDYTVPVVSLIKGERITRNIAKVLGDTDLRDLWLPFFCVSTNLTRSRVEVHDRFDAATAVRASVAIPGILPPVPFGGDLLVDGGVLNNLPCDVMRASGTVGRLIAVDLSPPVGPAAKEDFGLAVSGWSALRAQVRPGQSRFPGLMTILMRALVAGSVRDRDRMLGDGTVDWYLDLELQGVQLLDFERVPETAERGYEAARPRLEEWLAGSREPS